MSTTCAGQMKTCDIRLAEGSNSLSSFGRSDAKAIAEFDCMRSKPRNSSTAGGRRKEARESAFPLAAWHASKCSHLFNLMDAGGHLHTGGRAMARVRAGLPH